MFSTPPTIGRSINSFSPSDHHYFFADKSNSHRNTPEIVSVHSPLGKSVAMTHYDKPIPGYTTEYMASYTKPPSNAYYNVPVKLLNDHNNNFESDEEERSQLSDIGESHSSTLTQEEQTQLETKLVEALHILDKHHDKSENNNDLDAAIEDNDDDDLKKLKQSHQRNKLAKKTKNTNGKSNDKKVEVKKRYNRH